MNRLFIALVLIFGCASEPLTEEEEFERDYKRGMEVENWVRCEQIYANAGKPTMHMDHIHTKHSRIRRWMIHRDLFTNHCRYLLGREGWSD